MSILPMPIFNTLKSTDTLIAAGMPDAQARATVLVMADALESSMEHLATKDDLKMLGVELRGEMKQMASNLDHRMDSLAADFQQRTDTHASRLNRRMDKIEAELGHIKWMSGPVALVALIWIAKEALKVFSVVN